MHQSVFEEHFYGMSLLCPASLRQASPDFRAESLLKVPRVVGILVQENFVCIQGRRMTSAALHLADEKS